MVRRLEPNVRGYEGSWKGTIRVLYNDDVVPTISFQLLHLHPLTLEDILHQDPREKMVNPSPNWSILRSLTTFLRSCSQHSGTISWCSRPLKANELEIAWIGLLIGA